MIEIPIQVNGKVRETLTINANWSKEKVESLVLDSDTIQKYLDGQYVSRIIYVPGKILNVVTTKRN